MLEKCHRTLGYAKIDLLAQPQPLQGKDGYGFFWSNLVVLEISQWLFVSFPSVWEQTAKHFIASLLIFSLFCSSCQAYTTL